MKKNYYFLVTFLVITFTTNAQITITQTDLPVVNMSFNEVTDTVCANVSIGNAGTSQSWNLANIVNHILVTSTWVNPSSLPGGSHFPNATAAVVKPGSQDTYIKTSASSLEVLGLNGDFGSGFGVQSEVFAPPFKQFQFPATYLTSFNGNYAFEIKIGYSNPPIDSMKISFAVNYSSIIDGWGNVTTPAYSNIASLRQKNYSIATISSSTHNTVTGTWIPAGTPSKDTSINYIWMSNQYKYSLADIQTDPSGKVTQATYLLSSSMGISETAALKISITLFPNPAKENICIEGISQPSLLLVFDANGRFIANRFLKNYKNNINISDFNNGIYFYQIVDMNGKSIDNGKFTVAK